MAPDYEDCRRISLETADTKIRTVIWDYCGERISKKLLKAVEHLSRQLSNPQGKLKELVELLLPEEVVAFQKRVEWVLAEGVYPGLPGSTRRRRRG